MAYAWTISLRALCPSASALPTTAGLSAACTLRWATTQSVAPNRVLKELRGGQKTARIAPFALTAADAERAFEAWHRRRPLSPGGLLASATHPLRQTLLPFWLFDASFQVHYTGLLGFGVDGSKELVWRETHWRDRGCQNFPWTLPIMQVCASYEHRPDQVEVLKSSCMLEDSRPLSVHEAESQRAAAGDVAAHEVSLGAPEMRTSVAWLFATMAVKRAEAAAAERLLVAETGCREVKDVQVRLSTLRRKVRLVYAPAYTLEYRYGEHFNADGVRHPVLFTAVVSGASGAVAAERHFSPPKVQVAAAAAMGGLGALTAAVNLNGQSLLSPGTLLAALLICTSAGLAARLSPLLLRQHEEDRRIQVEDAAMEAIMSQRLGPQDVLDSKHEGSKDLSHPRALEGCPATQEARVQTEWRRWREANRWSWDGGKRRLWAEALWRRQQERRLQRAAFERNRARAEARYQAELEAEARRRARWGHDSHHSRFSHGDQNTFSGSQSGGGRRDFLGYYALLGLDGDLGSAIPAADIKSAFRKAALRWHPDVLQVDDEAERARAHERFAKVKRAYEVLRNPKKRKDYDSGVRDYS